MSDVTLAALGGEDRLDDTHLRTKTAFARVECFRTEVNYSSYPLGSVVIAGTQRGLSLLAESMSSYLSGSSSGSQHIIPVYLLFFYYPNVRSTVPNAIAFHPSSPS